LKSSYEFLVVSFYKPGKPLDVDFRRAIIDEIVKNEGNVVTGYFPSSITVVAETFHVARSTVRKIWNTFCNEFTENPHPKGGSNPKVIHF